MLRKLALLWYIIFLFSLFANSYAIQRDEGIINYISQININNNSSIDVTEKITVYANQDKIKNGIIRWLPTSRIDATGIKQPIHYRIKKVLLNQAPVTYHLENANDQMGIAIGNQNQLLNQATYIYLIEYEILNSVKNVGNHSKFIWNITGNDWNLPIVNAFAEIQLPKGITFTSFTANTGLADKLGHDFTTSRPDNNYVVFQLTRPLNPNEGFIITLTWPTIPFIQPLVHKVKASVLNVLILPIAITLFLLIYYLLTLAFLKKKNSYKEQSPNLYQNKKYLQTFSFILGFLLSITVLILLFYKTNLAAALSAIFWLMIWTYCCYRILLWFYLSTFKFHNKGNLMLNKNNIGPLLITLIFFTTEIFGIYLFSKIVSLPIMLILSAIIIINIFFYHFLKRPQPTNQWYEVNDFSWEKD